MKGTHTSDHRFFRFSLRQLMLLTAIVAVGCVALHYASPGTARVIFYADLLLLAFSTLFAIQFAQASRAFWMGVSLFGWLSLGVLNAHWFIADHSEVNLQNRPERLFHPLAYNNVPTTGISRALYRSMRSSLTIHPPASPPADWLTELPDRTSGDGSSVLIQNPDGTMYGTGPGPFYVPEQDFLAVADGLWVLLFGLAGGALSRWIFLRTTTRGDSMAGSVPTA